MTVSFDSSGISYKGSTETSIHNLVNTTSCTLYAPLTTTLALSKGTGDATYSRATTKWRFNELGYLQLIPAGCPSFVGARLVHNTISESSEDFSNAAWVKSNVTVTGTTTIVSSSGSSLQRIYGGALQYNLDETYRVVARLSYINHPFVQINIGTAVSTGYCNFDLLTGNFFAGGTATGKMVLVSPGVYDCTVNCLCTVASTPAASPVIYFVTNLAAGLAPSFTGDGVKSFDILRIQRLRVAGYAPSYIPEYIPVGLVSTPFYGANIDGARYFSTDYTGSVVLNNLNGINLELAATNNLLYSRDLSNAAWSTKTNITATKTALGLDNQANTATTLTANATDAIILQPVTLGSAARCTSAYVKRRSVTGAVYFTQNGGSSWTDISSLINDSTWSRVEITATLTNPSVGFKISSIGDAIDVDCVQNEAGTVATSPIVTTTAIVTRNADSLTYQTASNWSDTAGTAAMDVEPIKWSVGGLIGSATNGLLESDSNSGATSYDGTNAANGPTGTPSGRKKLAMSWGSSVMTVASSSVVGTPGTYDGAMGLSSIGVGVGSSGYYRFISIYNFAMNDAELKVITS